MTGNTREWDIWRGPALAVWLVFFAAGLMPEGVVFALRSLAEMKLRHVSSAAYVMDLLFTAYLTGFVFSRCREAGLSSNEIVGRAAQVSVAAFLAFLPIPAVLVLHYDEIPKPELQRILGGMAAAKSVAWIYLFILILRYYFWGGLRVFKRMHCVFPSAKPMNGLPRPQEHKRTAVMGGSSTDNIDSP